MATHMYRVLRSFNQWAGGKQRGGNPLPNPESVLWTVAIVGAAWAVKTTAAVKWAQLLDWPKVQEQRIKLLEQKVEDTSRQVNTRLDETNRRLDETNRRVDDLSSRMDHRFNETDRRFNQLERKLDKITHLLEKRSGSGKKKQRLPEVVITRDF